MKKLYQAIIVLAIVAFVNASYLSHKSLNTAINTSSRCDINSTISCTNVFANPASRIGGIPFPVFALVVYPIIFSIALIYKRRRDARGFAVLARLSAAGICFNSYFLYQEYTVIGSFCPLCLLCTGIIITIFILSLR